jgi:methylenetetrahydrofolate reductase (NADPH)
MIRRSNNILHSDQPHLDATAHRLRWRPLRHLNEWREGLNISFEYFPPKSDQSSLGLEQVVKILNRFQPEFSSVTYGAGGNVETRSFGTLRMLRNLGTHPLVAHLTWLDSNRSELDMLAERLVTFGVQRILALRGDPVAGGPHPDNTESYGCTVEFIHGLRALYDFDITVAGYPETHPQAPTSVEGIRYLKEKVDAGANRVLCQFCFDSDRFLHFRDSAVKAGINVPIIPGILPINDFDQTARFAQNCGASIPENIFQLFSHIPDNRDIFNVVSATVTAEYCSRLIDNGVTDFHFYTLNRYELIRSVCHILGIREEHPGNSVIAPATVNYRVA